MSYNISVSVFCDLFSGFYLKNVLLYLGFAEKTYVLRNRRYISKQDSFYKLTDVHLGLFLDTFKAK